MKIKFKAGRKTVLNYLAVQSYVSYYVYMAKLRGKKVKVRITYDLNTLYKSKNPTEARDWYKIFGTKSGVVTEKNQELIFAMRNPEGNVLHFAMYHRNKKVHWATEIRSVEVTKSGGYITYTVDPKYAIRVPPYNGGTYAAQSDNSYDMKLSLTK